MLRIVAHAATPDEAAAKAEHDVAFIRERLGTLVYGEDDETLATAVGRLLAERRQTLANAERLSDKAIACGLPRVKTPRSRSSASLSRVTRWDHRLAPRAARR